MNKEIFEKLVREAHPQYDIPKFVYNEDEIEVSFEGSGLANFGEFKLIEFEVFYKDRSPEELEELKTKKDPYLFCHSERTKIGDTFYVETYC